jgi:hypothetical protein
MKKGRMISSRAASEDIPEKHKVSAMVAIIANISPSVKRLYLLI